MGAVRCMKRRVVVTGLGVVTSLGRAVETFWDRILRGESGGAIILRELLPNIADLLTVEFALRASSALLLVSALSFLGLGLSPPIPDWGLMIHDGLQSIRSEPWLILVPALCISTLVMGINFATEGVADALGLEAARGLSGR
jgi:peptide/nickel transport system permease protein